LFISDRAHLLFDLHRQIDGLKEDELSDGKKIGTTKQGIGPCYSSKASRGGIRVGDLRHFDGFIDAFKRMVTAKRKRFGDAFHVDVDAEIARYREYAVKLEPFIIDTVYYVNKAIDSGKRILVEGANAALLDIDFGTYPFVTSSNTTIGGACTGLGIAPTKITEVVGVVKAYTTRVGQGPFPTELFDEFGHDLQSIGREFGTTTGRVRRCGWLDVVILRYTNIINRYTSINLTKLDVLTGFKELKIGVEYKSEGKIVESFPGSLVDLAKCEVVYETLPGWKEDITGVRKFEDLPENCRRYVERIEALIGVPIRYIGVGPARDAQIER